MKQKNFYIEILSLTNGLVILYLLTKNKWLLYISISIALASVIIPAFAKLIGGLLQKIVHAFSITVNIIILGIVFVLILTPISIIYRLLNKKKSFKNISKETFFITRDYTFNSEDFKKQW